MLNKIILKGNIGRHPEIKLTQQGKEMATFFLATNLPWKIRTYQNGNPGEMQSYTDWHRITVFRESSLSWIKKKLKQGDTVYVEGRLSYNSWKDRYNQTHVTSHVVVEDWQGHVEYLRPSKASLARHKVESEGDQETQDAEDPEDPELEASAVGLMESPFDGSSDFPSSEFPSPDGFLSPRDSSPETASPGDQPWEEQLQDDHPQRDQSQGESL